MMSEIDQAMKSKDAEALRRATHSLKSGSANVGAARLAELFRQLEHLAREDRMQEAEKPFREMQVEFARATHELRALLVETT